MKLKKPGAVLLLLVAALLIAPQINAGQTFVKHQNLAEMCDEAASIYRGKVLDIESGTMEIAGGELPTVTYKLEVGDTFKGEYVEKGGKRYAEFTVAGSFKPIMRTVGDYAQLNMLPSPPALRVGEEYLLLTNAPNEHGLSNTIGLAQGCFHISGSAKGEVVMNGANNAGLFRGMSQEGLAAAGALSYAEIAQIIRDGVAQ
jgi:hypothetical protein